jgi:hypothetical protein
LKGRKGSVLEIEQLARMPLRSAHLNPYNRVPTPLGLRAPRRTRRGAMAEENGMWINQDSYHHFRPLSPPSFSWKIGTSRVVSEWGRPMDKKSHGYERAKKMRHWRDRRGGMPPSKQPPLPSALAEPLEAWLNTQRRAQLSPATIQTRRLHVSRFLRWCGKRNVTASSGTPASTPPRSTPMSLQTASAASTSNATPGVE